MDKQLNSQFSGFDAPELSQAESPFFTAEGSFVPAVRFDEFATLYQELIEDHHMLPVQIVESAAYSLAMVIRYSMGLSADGGGLTVFASDSLQGQIALATTRHLIHSGSLCHTIIFQEKNGPLTQETERMCRILESFQATPTVISGHGRLKDRVRSTLGRSQHVLTGFPCGIEENTLGSLTALNEGLCPIHAVQCPPGVCPDTGNAKKEALFASSTLSLGVPLKGLLNAPDHIGRHFVCDISIPSRITDKNGLPRPLFPDQPLQKLYNKQPGSTH